MTIFLRSHDTMGEAEVLRNRVAIIDSGISFFSQRSIILLKSYWLKSHIHKEIVMLKSFILVLFLVFSHVSFAQTLEDESVEVESEASYLMQGDDSRALAKAIAQFEAKKRAVDVGAKYLSARGLIEVFDQRKKEIYALVTKEIQFEVLQEKWMPEGETFECSIRIIGRVKASDFIRGEAQDKALGNEELKESFKEEMEPTIAGEIDPAKDIARAYRLIREKQWRMAILYLDRLEMKYQNWGEIYMTKAIGYYALKEPRQMKRSIEKACSLRNEEACNDLKILKKVHRIDLDSQLKEPGN